MGAVRSVCAVATQGIISASAVDHQLQITAVYRWCNLERLIPKDRLQGIELKLNDHDQRLVAVEEVVSQLRKQNMAETSIKDVTPIKQDNIAKRQRFRRVIISSPSSSSNDSAYIREVLEDIFYLEFKDYAEN
ncbi:hypothetical protein OS493_019204 [Desmophyllum pertusum]|uniref:Uncharacterized protein n=1 Tax=Desmophyllum pertusum TaxID=174260 RepID=A0A9X0CGE5_9CNID|nr:hypothetical protein OS493_019204 [Desmophyllum pertusum]